MGTPSVINFGCQFYTWQMSGDKYRGRLDHIAGVVKESGFTGIEPETGMLGNYYDPVRMKELLARQGLALGALTLVCDWRQPAETGGEQQAAADALAFLGHFPGTLLVLCQMPGNDREQLRQRQENAVRCIEAVTRRAAVKGIVCAFHPNSPPGSVFRTGEDYTFLLDELFRRQIGFAPDSGHILRGEMDVYSLFESAASIIRHVHFKDIDARHAWVGMGKGITDFPRIVRILGTHGYRGWFMVEEESVEAESDPDTATRHNGEYVKNILKGEIEK